MMMSPSKQQQSSEQHPPRINWKPKPVLSGVGINNDRRQSSFLKLKHQNSSALLPTRIVIIISMFLSTIIIIGNCDGKQSIETSLSSAKIANGPLGLVQQQTSTDRSQYSAATSSTSTTTQALKPEHKTYPDQNVLVGRVAHLPCHMHGLGFTDSVPEPVQESEDHPETSNSPHPMLLSSSGSSGPNGAPSQPLDMIQLILWYHGDDISGSPFYSVDARQQSSSSANFFNNSSNESSPNQQQPQQAQDHHHHHHHQSVTSQWKHFLVDPYNDRARFVLNSPVISNTNSQQSTNIQQQSPFMLILDPVREQDDGLYWCRVDYRWTRTTISKVRLNVLAPPKQLTLLELSTNTMPFMPSSLSSSTRFHLPSILSSLEPAANQIDLFKSDLKRILSFNRSTTTSAQPISTTFFPFKINNHHDTPTSTSSSLSTQGGPPLIPQQIQLDESSDAIFLCDSVGGKPTPIIHWFWNNRRLDNVNGSPSNSLSISEWNPRKMDFNRIFSTKPLLPSSVESFHNKSLSIKFHVINVGLVQDRSVYENILLSTEKVVAQFREHFQWHVLSFLWIRRLERQDHSVSVRCQASNQPQVPLQRSLNKMFKLDINLNPTRAQIVDVRRDGVSSGSTMHATCLTWGSRPPAKIFWFLHDRPLTDVNEQIFDSNMTTKSQVRIQLQPKDNGQWLTCLALRLLATNQNVNVINFSGSGRNQSSYSNATQQTEFNQWIMNTILNRKQQQQQMNRAKMDNEEQQKQFSYTVPYRSNYYVYDQITLTVEYLPNITIDLLDPMETTKTTTASDNVSTTSSTDAVLEPNQTVTTNHPERNNKANGTNNNNSKKIFIKDRIKLRCTVDANPPPYKIRWLLNYRDISMLFAANEYHLSDKNRTLFLDGSSSGGLGRQHEGKYQCSAYNQLGRADSNELLVSVLRPPKCAFKSSVHSSTTIPSLSLSNHHSSSFAKILSQQQKSPLSSSSLEAHSASSMTKIDSQINYPTNLFCQIDATLPNHHHNHYQSHHHSSTFNHHHSSQQSSFDGKMVDDRLWIYWQLPNDPRHVLTMDPRGKLLRIPMSQLDEFRSQMLTSGPKVPGSSGVDQTHDSTVLMFEDLNLEDPNSNLHGSRRITLATKDVRSRLTIIPQSVNDFGLYQCWAENQFGSNRQEPCLFNLTDSHSENSKELLDQKNNRHRQEIIGNNRRRLFPPYRPSGLPDPVTNCSTSFTSGLVHIRCQHRNRRKSKRPKTGNKNNDDDDGSLQFHLIVREINPGSRDLPRKIIANQTNPMEPIFLLSNLPLSVYEAVIYSSNDYGQSKQTKILIQMDNANDRSNSMEKNIFHSKQHSNNIDDDYHYNSFENNFDDDIEFNNWHDEFGSVHQDDFENGFYDDHDDDDDDDNFQRSNNPIVVGKPDLHQQGNNFAHGFPHLNHPLDDADNQMDISNKNKIINENSVGSATPGSTRSDPGTGAGNGRFILMIIIIFTVVLIAFSTFLSISIGMCLYRRKRNQLLQRHQQQISTIKNSKQNSENPIIGKNFQESDDELLQDKLAPTRIHTLSSHPPTPIRIMGGGSAGGGTCSSIEKSSESTTTTTATGATTCPPHPYETFPLDDYSLAPTTGGGLPHHQQQVFILGGTNSHHHHAHQQNDLMIYRDFVSSPPSSSTSPATTSLLQPLTMHQGHGLGPMIPPAAAEFLYQPNSHPHNGPHGPFLDLGVDSGNVQLIPATSSPTTQSKQHATLLLTPGTVSHAAVPTTATQPTTTYAVSYVEHQPTTPAHDDHQVAAMSISEV